MTEKWHELIFSYLKNDIYSLRDILIKMKEEGMSAQDALQIFTDIRNKLQSEGNEKDEDRILDTMDIIVGYCNPRWKVWDN
ncbi:hypothetical protein A3860_39520 [Niastella vici]|uniref:Uncharacterized protein n=2 Tax=Niastella vici TaxID=1703345 RepID=A0A1V9FID8_9BACT|nr:hypothetical protein A3860_39520 [Niastella vici]